MKNNEIIDYLRAQGMTTKEISHALDEAKDLAKTNLFTELHCEFQGDMEKLIFDFENADLKCIKPSDILKIDPMSYCKKWGAVVDTFSSLKLNASSREIKASLAEVGINYNSYRTRTMPKEVQFLTYLSLNMTFFYGYDLGLNGEDYFLTGRAGSWSSFNSSHCMFVYKDILNWFKINKNDFTVSQKGLIYTFKLKDFSCGSHLDELTCSEDEMSQLIARNPKSRESNFAITERDCMLIASEIGQVEISSDDLDEFGYAKIKYDFKSTTNKTRGFTVSLTSGNYCLVINPVPFSQSQKAYICGEGYVNGELAYLSLDTLELDLDGVSSDFSFDSSVLWAKINQINHAGSVGQTDKIITLESKIKPKFGNFENKMIPAISHRSMREECSDYIDKVIEDIYGIKISKPDGVGSDKLIFSRSVGYVEPSEFNRLVSLLR